MTFPTTDLRAELEADFGRTRERLIEARLRQQMKDTPPHRAAVAACRAEIDIVLDLYLTVFAAPAELPAAPAVPPRSSGPVATAALRTACGAAPGAA
jgi:hypothetical protein